MHVQPSLKSATLFEHNTESGTSTGTTTVRVVQVIYCCSLAIIGYQLTTTNATTQWELADLQQQRRK